MTGHSDLQRFIAESEKLCEPANTVVCDGSDAEYERLIQTQLDNGSLLALNQKTHPHCYLHRSNPNDVARIEKLTFICSAKQEDAGPTNQWLAPDEAKRRAREFFSGSMRGRTMYVVPYLMGAAGSPFAKAGVEITDSPYVAASMRIMTRMGNVARDHIAQHGDFTPGLHSTADVNPERRLILHFPDEDLIWSVGSGYGGNALLGKKCHALRLASVHARNEGWLAEHMLILGLESPAGETTYIAAAFPSACGKTNLAMLVPPAEYKGWKIWTVGDDIAWLRIGSDGRLWAVNPEAGFFGVAPGTSERTNPNALASIRANTIFTNVAVTPGGEPWWEGLTEKPPEKLTDWQGRAWTPASMDRAAHPNSRFTAPARQCPSISPRWQDPQGVPIGAILFGGRRASVEPLCYEALSWNHGVFLGATLGSETTAAAAGKTGILRRDPMAMLPFCGYNMADYFRHWVELGTKIPKPPKIFRVDWFHKDEQGKYVWPGFSQNIRVLQWIVEQVQGQRNASESPLGLVPSPGALNLDGLKLSKAQLEELFFVDRAHWRSAEVPMTREFFDRFGAKMPAELYAELEALNKRMA